MKHLKFPWKFTSLLSLFVEYLNVVQSEMDDEYAYKSYCTSFSRKSFNKLLAMHHKKEMKITNKASNNIIKTYLHRRKGRLLPFFLSYFLFRDLLNNIERQIFNKHKICCDSEVSHKIQFLFCVCLNRKIWNSNNKQP